MPNNELQELLSSRFDDYTHSTDESVWESIEAQLDEEKSDRAGFWFWIFNGIAATLFTSAMIQSNFTTEPASNLSKSEFTENTINRETKEASTEVKHSTQSKSEKVESATVSNGDESSLKSNKAVTKETSTPNLTQTKKASELPKLAKNEFLESELPIRKEISASDVSNLTTHPLSSTIESGKIIGMFTELSNANNSRYLRHLPIHLGFEFTYLHRTRQETNWNAPVANALSDYIGSNDVLANNRHFEFSVFSQFDFTKRFAASIGIGYSGSRYVIEPPESGSLIDYSLPKPINTNLRVITIPIQAKFAFLQKNRFALSAGLTFQGEFGRIMNTETVQQESWATTTFPPEIQEEQKVTKSSIKQFALEPFLQLSIGISPRFSTFTNFGYRVYLGQSKIGTPSKSSLNFINADVGIAFQIR